MSRFKTGYNSGTRAPLRSSLAGYERGHWPMEVYVLPLSVFAMPDAGLFRLLSDRHGRSGRDHSWLWGKGVKFSLHNTPATAEAAGLSQTYLIKEGEPEREKARIPRVITNNYRPTNLKKNRPFPPKASSIATQRLFLESSAFQGSQGKRLRASPQLFPDSAFRGGREEKKNGGTRRRKRWGERSEKKKK